MAYPFPDLDILDISDSSRKSLWSCPRKFEFRKMYNSSRKEDSQAAGVGQALHIGVQHYMEHKNLDAAVFECMMAYPIETDEGPMKGRSLEAVYGTLIVALSHPKLQDYELAYIVVNGERKAAIEVPFRFLLSEFFLDPVNKKTKVRYNGRLDLILYNRLEDSYIVVDVKSTTKDMGDATPMYQFEEQLIPYALVLEKLLNRPITNLSILYMQLYVSALEPRCRWYSFEKSQADIQDWMRGLLIDLQQISTFYQMGFFPRHGNACTAYNRTCSQFDLCGYRDGKTIEMMLSMANNKVEKPEEVEPWVEIELNYRQEAA